MIDTKEAVSSNRIVEILGEENYEAFAFNIPLLS